MTAAPHRLLIASALVLALGCGDDTMSDASGGSTSSDQATSAGDPSGDPSKASGRISATFVFIDGTEIEFDAPAVFRSNTIVDTVQLSCDASDPESGLSLGVTWREETTAGSHMGSLTDGPFLVAAWPQIDGTGTQATAPGESTIVFDQVGTMTGDMVEGTAEATLMPDPSEPNERLQALVDVAFSCEVG